MAKKNSQSKKTQKPKTKKVSEQVQPGGISIRDWQVALRRQAAAADNLSVTPVTSGFARGEFFVRNYVSRRQYKVVCRGDNSPWNYCSCLDFKTSQLGTCKHIEAVKLWLEQNPGHVCRTSPLYTSVYLSYIGPRTVMLRIGRENESEFRQLAREFFDDELCLRPDAITRFPEFLSRASKINPMFRCYDDALDYVIEMRDSRARIALVRSLSDADLDRVLNATLFPYQKEGVRFAVEKGRAIIADEMGLGKTIQAIASAEVLRRHGFAESIIVACPTSLKYQWKREIERFAHAEVSVIEGDFGKRKTLYRSDAPYKIVSYHVLKNDITKEEGLETDIFILDEVQRLKNWDTKIAISARLVKSRYAIALSGTPLENKIEELYSVMELVDQYCLAPYYEFRQRYILQDESGKVVGYRNLNEVGERIAGRLIRRRKADVAIQLPSRQDKILLVPMTPQQMEAHEDYKSTVAQLIAKWQRNHFLSETDRHRLLISLNKMRMVCDSTYILDEESRHDVKVEETINIISEFLDGDPVGKVVVFSQWERMTRLIAAELDKREIPYSNLHGGVSSIKRGEMVANFQDDPNQRVFLSTDAGSTGLNLQSASLIINIDLPWNPAVLEQRIGRIYRYGQTRNIQVINLVAAKTIEEGMIAKLRFKQNMFEGVLDGGEDTIFIGDKFTKIVDIVESVITAPAEPTSATTGSAPTPAPAAPEPARKLLCPPIPSADPHQSPEPAQAPASSAEPPAPADLLQQGVSFIAGLAKTLQSPEATTKLISSIVKEDKETGKTYLNIPIPDKDSVQQALTLLTKLLSH
ncbi:MAG: DEAD/DEAH box helicase [Lepagella sp.]